MRILGAALVTLTLALTAPAEAAGPKEGQWYISPMLTFIDGDVDRLVDDGVRGGQLGLGYAFDSDWLLESYLQYNAFKGFQPADQWGLGIDMIRRFNSASHWSPYVLAGGGWLRTDPDGTAPRRDGAQFSAAAGLMGQVTEDFALRAEYRVRGDASSPGLTDQLISLGFTIGFGGQPEPAPRAAPAPEPAPAPPPPPPPPPAPAPPERPCPEPREGQPVDADGCALEIELQGVNFEFDSARLLGSSERILDEAVEILQRHPNLRVEVQGHTDSVGSAQYNLGLSDRRAASVREYLISQGVNPNNLTSRGYGQERPVASNDTDEGRARNRRVVLSFIVD